MHRSRLAALVIDCQADDLVTATRFWSAALGRAHTECDPAKDKYTGLANREGEPVVSLQKVDHPSRVHLDIESDDIEAEVARLEQLGARRVASVQTWVVMEAPSGHRFCVVKPQGQPGELERLGNRW
jgi:predicted enzyme related to lactoylglutathione lyase